MFVSNCDEENDDDVCSTGGLSAASKQCASSERSTANCVASKNADIGHISDSTKSPDGGGEERRAGGFVSKKKNVEKKKANMREKKKENNNGQVSNSLKSLSNFYLVAACSNRRKQLMADNRRGVKKHVDKENVQTRVRFCSAIRRTACIDSVLKSTPKDTGGDTR